ncbi:MAG: diacylglycerol kinase family protein [Croceibacterium sp.]
MTEGPLPVVINRGGGTADKLGDKLTDEVTAAFAAAGCPIDLHLVDGGAIKDRVSGLTAPVVAVGGGDGTQGAAAAELAEHDRTLAVLPLGTRNHLARQLGIPLELAEAAKVAAQGSTTRIDLARGNGRVFVNNASIGLYTRLVRERDRRAGPKWLGTIPATWHVLRHLRARPLCLVVDGKRQSLRTPLLFIGNNRYSLEAGQVGERNSLTDGVLSLFAVDDKGPLALIAFALRALVGLAHPEQDFAALAEARTVEIEGSGAIDVAFDGEVERMTLPLTFEIMPLALAVRVPASADRAQ